VNCGAIPETLVESHLFGHCKGAFTGADSDQAGKFELADGGTLFLDEIGELPLAVQPKLLTVLDDGLVERIGAAKTRKVRVRIVTATNRNIRRQVANGKFREDLYYRISYAAIRLPPLRERRSDIPELAARILDGLNPSLRIPCRLAASAVERLQEQAWKGNIRDLEHVIGRSVLLSESGTLNAEDLVIAEPAAREDWWASLPSPHEGFSLEGFLTDTRKQLILRALDQTNGNQAAAARLLGVSPQAVSKFLKRAAAQ
jgi:transcriptional regulator with GAF, ATPase, and Fis domain